MRIDVLTLFPGFFQGPLQESLLGKAIRENILDVGLTNIRDFATDKHNTVDDAPYGGGPGMVMKCGPIFEAVESLRGRNSLERIVLMSPRGKCLTQEILCTMASEHDMVLICGRYEGVDERVAQALCTEEISVGDYVLSGGEAPALTIIEGVSRLLPGVVGDPESVRSDSFYEDILAGPQYTRPATFRDLDVPPVLLEGNHAVIEAWRRKEALKITKERRQDLLNNLTAEDRELLAEIEGEQKGTTKS